MTEHERIADLERQLETWKVIQRTNDASIKMWQDIHQKDQRCLIHMAKRLNHVTAQCVELKVMNDRLQEQLIVAISQATTDEECAEVQSMWEAFDND